MITERGVKTAFVVAIVLFISLWALIYVYARNSSAYAASEQWVRASEGMREYVGPINRIGLYPTGFSIRYAGGSTRVRLVLSVKGEDRAARVRVEMHREGSGDWRVTRSGLLP